MFTFNMLAKNKLVLDISSGSVGLFIISRNKMVYSSRKNFYFLKDGFSFKDIFANDFMKLIKNESVFINELLKMDTSKMEVYAFLHQPFYSIKPEVKTISFKKPKKINIDVIKDNLDCDKDQQLYINKINIKGYNIIQPEQLKTQDFKVYYTKAYLNANTQNMLQEFCGALNCDFNSLKLFDFISSAILLAAHTSDESDYIIVDMGEFYSQITLVRNSAIAFNTSMDFGTRKLVHAIAEELDISKELAKSRLKMYYEGALIPYWYEKVSDVIEVFKQTFKEHIQEQFEILATEYGKLPSRVFFSCDMFTKKAMSDVLSDVEFARFTITEKVFDVGTIAPSKPELYSGDAIFKDDRFVSEYFFIKKSLKDHVKHCK